MPLLCYWVSWLWTKNIDIKHAHINTKVLYTGKFYVFFSHGNKSLVFKKGRLRKKGFFFPPESEFSYTFHGWLSFYFLPSLLLRLQGDFHFILQIITNFIFVLLYNQIFLFKNKTFQNIKPMDFSMSDTVYEVNVSHIMYVSSFKIPEFTPSVEVLKTHSFL